MPVVHIIYASTSGNVEIVVETVAKHLREAQLEVELHRAEQTGLEVITNNDTFILATSTWEHGQLNPFFEKLYKELKTQNLQGKRATFVGCGDTRYEPILFNQGIKIIHKAWLAQQGEEFHRQLLINGEPYHVLDTRVAEWAQNLAELLKAESHA